MKKITSFIVLFFICNVCNLFGQSSNDACASAVTLTLGATCTSGSIVTANTSTGEPVNQSTSACWSFNNDDGVWYKFTATTSNAMIDIDKGGSTYNSMVAVYSGGCPSTTATPIATGCKNYSTSQTQELGLTGLTAGTTYYILVDYPSTLTGSFCISALNAPVTTTASTTCPASVNSTVSLMTCADVGTGNLEQSSGAVVFSGLSTTAPPVAPTCGGTPSEGSWAHYDLASGVTTLTFNWEDKLGGSTDLAGGAGIYMQVYQGSSCAALTTFSCAQVGAANPPGFSVNSSVIQNLDPAQDVWIYMFHTAATSKDFILPFDATGSTTPANDACSGAASSTVGCNLGSIGDAMGGSGTSGGPMNEGGSCSGGTWYSNENTVWYTFSATTTTANITITNITCNNGESGLAQFMAVSNCTCTNVNAYALSSCYLGCAAGTGSINLGSLTPGQTVYLAVDGNAGDVCKMGFVTALVPLPLTWLDFYAKKKNSDVKLIWSSIDEVNTSHFEIERTLDGVDFTSIGNVKSAGNSGYRRDYNFTDYGVKTKQVYYRIKQIDNDGAASYSKMIYVDFDAVIHEPDIYYSQYEKSITIKFDPKYYKDYDIEITDTYGKLILTIQNTDPQGSEDFAIPVHDLQNGVYIVQMKGKDGLESFTKKLVIY